MAAILCLDFDDTIVRNNLTTAIFERFAGPRWREHETGYQAGRMSVEQFNAAALDCINPTVTRDELEACAREAAVPREGLADTAGWASWHGWALAVVSNGFDFAVSPVLDDLKLDRVARHCGRTRNDYRWRVRYDSPRGIEVQEGFKVAYAAAFKGAGDLVAYVGDGASDVDAASLAYAVFARSTLLERLAGAHPRVFPFETFHDVTAVLEREADTWLASFSSTTAAEA